MTIRTVAMGIVIAFALGFVGCRSCLAPYDHCQPTFIPERGDQCMGELYRCGSVVGGSERESAATGECESCGGGDSYTANGFNAGSSQPTESATFATEVASERSSQAESFESYSSVNYEAPRGASAANEYATVGGASRSAVPNGLSTEYSASFDANEFRLNDDAGDYAVDR